MAVIADRHRHRNIDAHHADRDLRDETLGRIAITREHRNRVALVMDGRVAQRLLERLRTNDLQHGAEDLVLVALQKAWSDRSRSATRKTPPHGPASAGPARR